MRRYLARELVLVSKDQLQDTLGTDSALSSTTRAGTHLKSKQQ